MSRCAACYFASSCLEKEDLYECPIEELAEHKIFCVHPDRGDAKLLGTRKEVCIPAATPWDCPLPPLKGKEKK